MIDKTQNTDTTNMAAKLRMKEIMVRILFAFYMTYERMYLLSKDNTGQPLQWKVMIVQSSW